jgi:hypothetical protein
MDLVILLEEYSAKAFLDAYLPRILPEGISFITVPHQGKSDLEKSIPIKLRAWRTPDTRFVILRDQDQADCGDVKEGLLELCRQGRKDALVRIACRTLEAWFLGDLDAVQASYPGSRASTFGRKARYRKPDSIIDPVDAIRKIVPEFQKVDGARRLGKHVERERNISPSFETFVSGVLRYVAQE